MSWLDNLKKGSQVIVFTWNWGDVTYRYDRVEKITPTGLIKVSGILYNKDGYARGNLNFKLENPYDYEVQKRFKKYEEEKFISNVRRLMHNTWDITYEQAKQILDILEDKE